MAENSRDVCIVNCKSEVEELRACLDRRDAATDASKNQPTGVDCMPDVVKWKDCCEKAKYKELESKSKVSAPQSREKMSLAPPDYKC